MTSYEPPAAARELANTARKLRDRPDQGSLAELRTDARRLAAHINALARTGTPLGDELWSAVSGAAGVLGVLDVLESGTRAADAVRALAHVQELAEQVADALTAAGRRRS